VGNGEIAQPLDSYLTVERRGRIKMEKLLPPFHQETDPPRPCSAGGGALREPNA
jgi:hypothetical protein